MCEKNLIIEDKFFLDSADPMIKSDDDHKTILKKMRLIYSQLTR
jgi:hypothetical protein